MACQYPIWIRNRRYFDKARPRTGFNVDCDHKSALALRPWDVSRQWLMVPCGKCDDCLRRLRNDWFVRIERELARCKAESRQAIFITITISPQYYESALRDPSWFIRKWNERVRHRIGHSFKHCFFQEFGTHPESGVEPRLHFHGFLFGTNVLYNTIRSAVSDLGYVWLSKASHKRARYCVKYVVKQISYDSAQLGEKTVSIDGKPTLLSHLLQHKRYTRKFVSAGVGDYLGIRRAPSFSVSSWPYTDLGTGRTFNYAIPRYYNRYLQPKDEQKRAIRSADAYARFSKSPLVRRIVDLCVKLALPSSALSSRETYSWEMKKFREFASAGDIPDIQAPVWLDRDIVRFWHDHYGLSLT